MICFNSKLVRLEAIRPDLIMWGPQVFQFQTGSIRSDIDQGIYGGLRGFQFQTGSIRRCAYF